MLTNQIFILSQPFQQNAIRFTERHLQVSPHEVTLKKCGLLKKFSSTNVDQTLVDENFLTMMA